MAREITPEFTVLASKRGIIILHFAFPVRILPRQIYMDGEFYHLKLAKKMECTAGDCLTPSSPSASGPTTTRPAPRYMLALAHQRYRSQHQPCRPSLCLDSVLQAFGLGVSVAPAATAITKPAVQWNEIQFGETLIPPVADFDSRRIHTGRKS